MRTYHPMVAKAIEAVNEPKVQEMIKELSKYGLGVFMPHLHTKEGFAPLPIETVQLEADLKVSFVKRGEDSLKDAAPVGWVWDSNKAEVVMGCACTGAEHDPHWPKQKFL